MVIQDIYPINNYNMNPVPISGPPRKIVPIFDEPISPPPTTTQPPTSTIPTGTQTSWTTLVPSTTPIPTLGNPNKFWENFLKLNEYNTALWKQIGVSTKEGFEKLLFGATDVQLEELRERLQEHAAQRRGYPNWRYNKKPSHSNWKYSKIFPILHSRKRVRKRKYWNKYKSRWEWIKV